MIHPDKEKLFREAGLSDRLMAGLDDGIHIEVQPPVSLTPTWLPAAMRSWRQARRDMVTLRWDRVAKRWVSSA